MASANIKLKETVQNLRLGWYGNEDLLSHSLFGTTSPQNYELIQKKPADCYAIFKNCIKMANRKFIPMFETIESIMGD
jgi:hypothetical protein